VCLIGPDATPSLNYSKSGFGHALRALVPCALDRALRSLK